MNVRLADASAKDRAKSLSAYAVFFDFDNTITPFDVLDRIVEQFSPTREWVALEKAWEAGTIGSKTCLAGQLNGLRVTRPALARFLSSVPVDASFKPLITLLRAHGVEPVIVSDNFLFVVDYVLRHHDIEGLQVYANRVRFVKDRLIPSFPYYDKGCQRGCANCKKRHVTTNRSSARPVMYIGDGRSDLCAAEVADLVFAKGRLRQLLRRAGHPCVGFDNLGTVYRYVKELER